MFLFVSRVLSIIFPSTSSHNSLPAFNIMSPPPSAWRKANTDGSFVQSNRHCFGGVFQDKARFSTFLSSTAAKFVAFIETVQVARVQNWDHTYRLTCSSFVLHYKALGPFLYQDKLNGKIVFGGIYIGDFICSHIFHEEKTVADGLVDYH